MTILLHYNGTSLTLVGAVSGQHTTAALAFGTSHPPFNPSMTTAVILRYGP